MKQLILYIVAALLLCSCCSSRKISESHTQTIDSTSTRTEQASVNWTEIAESVQRLESILRDSLIVEVTEREYDTSLPMDSITGKTPLKKETVTHITNIRQATSIKESANKSESVGESLTTKTDSARLLASSADTSAKETEQRSCFWVWLLLVGMVVVGIVIYKGRG